MLKSEFIHCYLSAVLPGDGQSITGYGKHKGGSKTVESNKITCFLGDQYRFQTLHLRLQTITNAI
jgi:hypothetical protein